MGDSILSSIILNVMMPSKIYEKSRFNIYEIKTRATVVVIVSLIPYPVILINILFYYCKIILPILFAFSLYIANVKSIRGKCTQRILYHSTIHMHPCLRSGKHTDSRCTSWKSTLLARATMRRFVHAYPSICCRLLVYHPVWLRAQL